MKTIGLKTQDGRSIAQRVQMACNFKDRCVGLIRHSSLQVQEGILLIPGSSVHTMGLKFPIDVVFLDQQLRILGLRQHMVPWRFAVAPIDTRIVLQLQAGKIAGMNLSLNDWIVASFDDDKGQAGITTMSFAANQRLGKRSGHPRPSSSCISFSLRLPLKDASVPVPQIPVIRQCHQIAQNTTSNTLKNSSNESP